MIESLFKSIPTSFEIKERNGVYSFLTAANCKRLNVFNETLLAWRKKRGEIERLPYEKLPYLKTSFWQSRQFDLEMIRQNIPNKSCKILELGAWNGWLAYNLSKEHEVIAIDYFDDSVDGLGAIQSYPKNSIVAIQMLPLDIGYLKPDFDVIIFNRNLSYLPDYTEILSQAKTLLKASGKLVITGIHIHQNKPELREMKDLKLFFQDKNVSFPFENGFKEYLDRSDLQFLKDEGIQLIPYPKSLKQRISATFKPTSVQSFIGIL